MWIFCALLATVVVYYYYPEQKIEAGAVIDRIVVLKKQRKLLAYSEQKLIKTYSISLGGNPKGHKELQGDKKTPEGLYIINDKNPNSGYHKNLGISYPNEQDVQHAKRLGKSPGGDVKIHGLRNGRGWIGKFHRWTDWTLGCIAITDSEMDELYKTVKIGAVIEIRP